MSRYAFLHERMKIECSLQQISNLVSQFGFEPLFTMLQSGPICLDGHECDSEEQLLRLYEELQTKQVEQINETINKSAQLNERHEKNS